MFWELIFKFVMLSTAICYIALGMYVTLRIQRNIVVRIKRYHGRKLVAQCKGLGAKLYYNKLGKTMAVCSVDDYQKAILPVPSWETQTPVWVKETFVFFLGESLQSKMHVNATMDEVKAIFDDLVTERTGYTRDMVDRASFEESLHLLVRRNEQLFVPFSSHSLPQRECARQADFYGNAKQFYDVRSYLIRQ